LKAAVAAPVAAPQAIKAAQLEKMVPGGMNAAGTLGYYADKAMANPVPESSEARLAHLMKRLEDATPSAMRDARKFNKPDYGTPVHIAAMRSISAAATVYLADEYRIAAAVAQQRHWIEIEIAEIKRSNPMLAVAASVLG
jgi:hypothetical protein